MVIGPVEGQLATATKIAANNGASTRHADDIETALPQLHSAVGADLVMADVAVDIRRLAARLHLAGLSAPVIACGTRSDTATAVAAIRAGAKEYIPLPADPDVIAAILAAVADDGHEAALPLAQVGLAKLPRHSAISGRAARPPHPTLPPRGEKESAAASRKAEFFTDLRASLDIPLLLAGRDGDAMAKVAHATLAAETVTRSLVGRTVADVERDLILATLKRCLGNRTHAASILGISVRTLRNKLTVYAAEGIQVTPPNTGEMRGAA